MFQYKILHFIQTQKEFPSLLIRVLKYECFGVGVILIKKPLLLELLNESFNVTTFAFEKGIDGHIVLKQFFLDVYPVYHQLRIKFIFNQIKNTIY